MTPPNPPTSPPPWPPCGGPPHGGPPHGGPPQGPQPWPAPPPGTHLLPYRSAPPQGPFGYAYLGYGGVPCPRCDDPRSSPVAFTWWGGFIGPRLLNHVRCAACGSEYKSKTGRSNANGIIAYLAVGLGVVAVLFGLIIVIVIANKPWYWIPAIRRTEEGGRAEDGGHVWFAVTSTPEALHLVTPLQIPSPAAGGP